MGLLLSLCAAGAFGLSGHVAGASSRSAAALDVALWTQSASLLSILAAVVALRPQMSGAGMLWGLLAGTASGPGIAATYRSLALGPVAVTAPLASCGGVVPFVAGVALGRTPGMLADVGMALVVVGVAASVRTSGDGRPVTLRAVAFALFAASCSGAVALCLSLVVSQAAMWSLLLGTVLGGVVSLAVVRRVVADRDRNSSVARRGVPARPASLAGVLDAAGFVLFVQATLLVAPSVVAVVTSLYPAVIVGLGWLLLGERVTRWAAAGVATTLAGLAILAAVT